MAKVKYMMIDTLTLEDTNAMAEAICLKVAKISVLEAKRNVLKLSGKDADLNKHLFNVKELLSLIAKYDIPTELKIAYVDTEFAEPVVEVKKDTVTNPTSAAIETQKEEVKMEVEKSISTEKKEDKKIEGIDLPDPPNFLD